MGTEWKEGETLRSLMKEAASTSPPSGTKIRAVANECMKQSKEYKLVVHELERHIRKSINSESRVTGLYVIDSVLHYANHNITKRLGDKMAPILSCFDKTKEIEKRALSKVLGEWVKRKTFPENIAKLFDPLLGLYVSGSGAGVSPMQSSPYSMSPMVAPFVGQGDVGNTSSSRVSGAAATVLSTLPPAPPSMADPRDPRKRGSASSSNSSSGTVLDPRKRAKMAKEEEANGVGKNSELAESADTTDDQGAITKVGHSDSFARMAKNAKGIQQRPFSIPITSSCQLTNPFTTKYTCPDRIDCFNIVCFPPPTYGAEEPVQISQITLAEFGISLHPI